MTAGRMPSVHLPFILGPYGRRVSARSNDCLGEWTTSRCSSES
ncbi:hypothetical protein SCATT_10370 [Streptantibioticus cattleyicolor NRRL 8057 = DSM 46488]|uniref:Uncharacterized protein n=1 Tax=Streptantibioticus cattleyicolor (strain ATCC 35852 / DSM 46488 / JCM 4925 / NBRC 14057 / NRRL 8057) TaxID=1003195 RepID=G8WNT5_STREN|nr:hypothetical protein SCATT_10370 [Streptantibioticus cattleyicolor NRRL 8057 = DSM 46488]